MKKFLIFILVIALGVGGYFGYNKLVEIKKENERVKEVKKGWYVEVVYKYVNVREKSESHSKKIGQVKKGEVYKVLEYYGDSSSYHWYKIELKDGKTGWIANTKSAKSEQYLKDVGNPEDIATPRITFEEYSVKFESIDDINYDHLTLWDDKDDYTVSHVVYHEYEDCSGGEMDCELKDQYWIRYTITDASGKSSSKTQKIEFENRPASSEVKDFYKEYSKDK